MTGPLETVKKVLQTQSLAAMSPSTAISSPSLGMTDIIDWDVVDEVRILDGDKLGGFSDRVSR